MIRVTLFKKTCLFNSEKAKVDYLKTQRHPEKVCGDNN